MRCYKTAQKQVTSKEADSRLSFSSKQIEVFRQIAQEAHPPRKFGGVGNIASPSSNILALFSGPSGTGKTMAAEVIARELRTRVYRVKPREVVGRYIGETEKNLTRIFGAAQKTGAVLLFDEADALFGKRTKVKDSHDRYANVEVSALLAKIESYQGVIILTSNQKPNIDPRIACRMKYLIEFSPPIPSPQVLPRR